MVSDLIRMVVILLIAGWIFSVSTHSGTPRNPLSRKEIRSPDPVMAQPTSRMPKSASNGSSLREGEPEDVPVATADATNDVDMPSTALLESIKDYVDTPEGAVDWQVFGRTKQKAYTQSDGTGTEWMGLKPEFSSELKRINGQRILIKGYMFPLGQQEKQSTFLLGPFPVSCP
ncbi:MAG: hypothetical protein AAFV29_10020, partial [Myxococcota bacterium]